PMGGLSSPAATTGRCVCGTSRRMRRSGSSRGTRPPSGRSPSSTMAGMCCPPARTRRSACGVCGAERNSRVERPLTDEQSASGGKAMSEEGFLRSILDGPRDDVSPLVYADWLEEQEGPEPAAKAEFLRLTVELAHVPERLIGRRKAVAERLQQLA